MTDRKRRTALEIRLHKAKGELLDLFYELPRQRANLELAQDAVAKLERKVARMEARNTTLEERRAETETELATMAAEDAAAQPTEPEPTSQPPDRPPPDRTL